MRAGAFVACMIAGVAVAGCSIHPLPDDLSQANTFAIVNNIRCEVKHKIEERLVEIMRKSRSAQIRDYHLENLKTDIQKFGRTPILLRLAKLDPAIALKVVKYGSITIGYTFTFDIDEKNNNDNNNGVDLSFGLPWTHSKGFGLGVGVNANLTRHATRTFAISETFLDLIALDCTKASVVAPNHAYPIVGSIGAGDIIDAYLDLGKSGATADRGADWRGTGTTAGSFTDELTFTTEIGGDIHPSITLAPLAPVPGRFRLVSAKGDFAAGRTDTHTLTIVIPFPTIDDRLGAGVNLNYKWFTDKEYQNAVTLAKKTIAYEFCIQRAKTGASPTTPGVHRPPEDYCADEARQKTLR